MNEIWLTQDAFDRLKAELDERSGDIREEIKQRIAAAREEGDLKENGGYHAAREEQGKNEARIRQLAHMLETAIIGTPEIQEGKVSQGMVVAIHFVEFDDDEEFLLGSREELEHVQQNPKYEKLEVYSPTSPLGAAVLGQDVGAEISYQTPAGKTLNIIIKSAELYES